jgi:transcriptional regulator with XRE-family HTH domain
MTPGQLLRRSRTRAGLTQAELARRAGTSQPVVSAYEHDRRDPTIGTLRRLLRATNATLELRTTTPAVGAAPATDPTTERQRAERLVDVLLLADAIPARPRGELTFPGVRAR